MLEIAHLLERNRTESNSFAVDAAGAGVTPATIGIQQSPQQGQAAYNLTFVNAANTYSITATPVGSQTRDTRCGILTLNQTGTPQAAGPGGVAECW